MRTELSSETAHKAGANTDAPDKSPWHGLPARELQRKSRPRWPCHDFCRARQYCHLHKDEYEYQPFHVEHIIAKQHGGSDNPENCCWACSECNWSKGPNLSGLLDGRVYSLFNPRTQEWKRHFLGEHTLLVGKTKIGIVTVHVLNINDPNRIRLRENLFFEGLFPPEL